MANALAEKLYLSSPAYLQRILINQFGRNLKRTRYDDTYRKIEVLLAETEWFDASSIASYQEAKFLEMARHAIGTVPYYRAWARSTGLKSEDLRSLADLRRFPLIDKSAVRAAPNEFLSESVPAKARIHGHTSGTTGSPLGLWYSQYNVTFTAAVDWRQKRWAGVDQSDRGAYLLGRTIVRPDRSRPPFGHYIEPLRQFWFSSFHLSDDYFPWFEKQIEKHRVAYIEGYPSTLATFAKFADRRNKRLSMKAAFSSSETLYPEQRELIEHVFDCRLHDFFGLAERTAFATECGATNGKHLNFEYALNEVVDHAGNPVGSDQTGFLVGTSLTNLVMPLIRYKTSDQVTLLSGDCRCGRKMPMISNVATKWEDIIVTPDGRHVSPSILTHPFKPFDEIEKSQIVHESPDRLRILLVMRTGNLEEVTAELEKGLRRRLGDEIQIEFQRVDDIPRAANGKYRWVISKVNSSP